MLAELGRLAREGVLVAPHDGLDLVHGFFLDEWPRTYATYRAVEGDPWPYVRTAFRRYVRREARREAQHRFADDLRPSGPGSEPPDPYDLSRVGAAVRSLDALRRQALWTYLATASERATAGRLGLSRARTRTLLEEALAHVAAVVEPSAARASPTPLSLAKTRRDPSQLLSALRAALPPPTPHAPTPVQTDLAMNATDLLRPYLSGIPSDEHRQALRESAHAVLDALDAGDPHAASAFEEGGGTAEGYEALYEDLATALHPSADETAPDLSASRSDLAEEAAIGELFLALVKTHPQNGMSLEMGLSQLSEVDHQTRERVYNSTPAAAAAGLKGAFLANRGLTPMDFLQAADAIGDLVERLGEETGEPVYLSDEGKLESPSGGQDAYPGTLFADEVAHVTALEPEAAQLVLKWLLGTAIGGAPGVFTGVVAERCQPCSVILRFDPATLSCSLEQRWNGVSKASC